MGSGTKTKSDSNLGLTNQSVTWDMLPNSTFKSLLSELSPPGGGDEGLHTSHYLNVFIERC